MIDYTARWLLQHLPVDSRRTLVHGDFRNGNLMIDAGGIRAVLDWELAQIGDPVRDLGWLCVNSWRFGRSDLPVGGFGTVEDLLEGYRAVSGIDIDRAELTFWQVFGSFWWAVTTLYGEHPAQRRDSQPGAPGHRPAFVRGPDGLRQPVDPRRLPRA